MKRDFTLNIYKQLIKACLSNNYHCITLKSFFEKKFDNERILILRHDIDLLPENGLRVASIEYNFKISGTYYFRSIPKSFDVNIIKKIAAMGHEIGYHYEDLALKKGDYEKAIESFGINLNKFKSVYPVSTISMHGSPMTKWDNRLLWQRYDYRDYGILGEPYFDLDFNDWLYVTDTGRSWNNSIASVRDKVDTSYSFAFSSTFELILAIERNDLPDRVMINIHPQRWHDKGVPWATELLSQSVKNCIKRAVVQSMSARHRTAHRDAAKRQGSHLEI